MACLVVNYSSGLSSYSDSGMEGLPMEPQRQARAKSCSNTKLGMAVEERTAAANGSTGEEERKLHSAMPLQTAMKPQALTSAKGQEAGDLQLEVEVESGTQLQLSSTAGTSPIPASKYLPQAWWEGQLAEGIHQTLKKRETMLETINLASPQLHKRTDLVNFVSAVCKCLPLSDTTRHLAILLLDHFMEKHDIMDYRLKLVGLTCLLVAAKMEDRDEHLPSIGQLRRLAKLENRAEYSREEFHRMELYLMKFFDWSVSYPTAAHFIGYYNANCLKRENGSTAVTKGLTSSPSLSSFPDFPLSLSSVETDFLDSVEMDFDLSSLCSISECELEDVVVGGWGDTPLTPLHEQRDMSSLHHRLEEVTASLLEKSLKDYRFLGYPPSVVAAAAVCAARIHLSLTPSWTSALEGVSKCSKQVLSPVLELFICLGYV